MIKFRAWSKDLSKYRKLDDISNDQGLGMFFEVQNGIGSNVTSICYSVGDVVEQFTGLTDVNGDDIYVGDIVKNERNEVHRVSFIPRAGCFAIGDCYFKSIGAGKILKVIGNVHENPELLEE